MGRGVHDDLHPLTEGGPDRRFRLGNPLESEQAAFRWVVAVIIAAALVILLAKLISSTVGFIAALLLGAFVSIVAMRGAWRMIRGTDKLDGEGPEDPQAASDGDSGDGQAPG
ncbi:MAG: hypothetical protein ACKOB2_07215 [Solirubrobacterales bacterium]